MKNTPVVTITCERDLPMLNVQAQSINMYLDKDCPVYIIVNEDNASEWFVKFDKIKHYYNNHHLTVLTKLDFTDNWGNWIPSQKNPWAVGWETQQILKLAIATKINSKQFLILDTQNFLIKPWSPTQYGYINNKIPARPGHFVMPEGIREQYSKSLGFDEVPPKRDIMSICTPIFLSKQVCESLIDNRGGIAKFAEWFKHASAIKSEFILYNLWAEHLNGFWHHHYIIPEIEDWSNPYLRDCRSEEEFLEFYNFIGKHAPHAWVSINHRAWGNMTQEQYRRLSAKLLDYKLTVDFSEYRRNYVDLKF